MAKGKITYQQFITKFKKLTTPEEIEQFVESHIVTKYVNYNVKLANIKQIVELGNHTDIPAIDSDDTKKVFKRNTPLMYLWMELRLLENYTDITIPEDEILTAYDALSEIGAINVLLSSIPEIELKRWQRIFEMANDDVYTNERDIASFFETKIDSLEVVLNTMLSGLGEVASKLELANNED